MPKPTKMPSSGTFPNASIGKVSIPPRGFSSLVGLLDNNNNNFVSIIRKNTHTKPPFLPNCILCPIFIGIFCPTFSHFWHNFCAFIIYFSGKYPFLLSQRLLLKMNLQRFLSMPNALKPLILAFVLLTMLLAASSPGKSPSGAWFFWLNILVQFIFITAVCALFLYECETFLTMGRDGGWPVLEMSYSAVLAFCNLVNTFILAGGHKFETEKGSNNLVVAAFSTLFLTIFYCIGGLMMFRIWRGFVKSGASQNPTPNIQAGDIGGMHPGV